MPRVLLGWAVLSLVHGAVPSAASAQPPGEAADARSVLPLAPDVRVLLLAFEAGEWTSRARSQLADVTGSVSEASVQPPASLPEQLALARRLGNEQSVDIVAWLTSDSVLATDGPAATEATGTFVVIWTASIDSYATRRLSEPWSQLSVADRSAALEMGGMSVRSAVRALQLERDAAAGAAPRAAPPAPASPPAPNKSQDPPSSPPESTLARIDRSASELRAWGWQAGTGLRWQLDGQTGYGVPAIAAMVGLRYDEWSLSLVAGVGLEATIETPGAKLDLVRHTLGLEAARVLAASARFSVAATLQATLQWSQRETRSTSPDVLPMEPKQQLAPAFAAGMRGSYRLSAAHALSLDVAAGWYPLAPSYIIEDPLEAERAEYALWKLQPALALGWSFQH